MPTALEAQSLNHWTPREILEIYSLVLSPGLTFLELIIMLSLFSSYTYADKQRFAQSCLTLCDPTVCGPPCSSVHGYSPGKNMSGFPCPHPGTIPTQGWNPSLPHYRQILYCLSHRGSPRILEWVPIPFSRDLPNPGIKPSSPTLQADSTIWATREAHICARHAFPICATSFFSMPATTYYIISSSTLYKKEKMLIIGKQGLYPFQSPSYAQSLGLWVYWTYERIIKSVKAAWVLLNIRKPRSQVSAPCGAELDFGANSFSSFVALIKKEEGVPFLVLQWLRTCLLMWWMWVWSLVRELRSHMLSLHATTI